MIDEERDIFEDEEYAFYKEYESKFNKKQEYIENENTKPFTNNKKRRRTILNEIIINDEKDS